MTRRSFPALGFDPTPGELEAVQAVLLSLRRAIEAAARTLPRLQEACSITDDAEWGGSAAEEFSDHADDLPIGLTKGIESMGKVTTALGEWAGQLNANQAKAEELEDRARKLKAQIAAAEDDLIAAARAIPADTSHPQYAQRQAAYLGQVDRTADLDEALRAVIEQARRLEAKHLREANAAADGVRSGPDDAFEPENDAWYVQTLDGVSKVSGIVSAATAAAAAGLAITGVGAPAAAVLGTVAAGTAGISTLAGIGQRITGSRNAPSTVVLALSAIPGRTYTSALVGAGRGALRPAAGVGRTRGGLAGGKDGAAEGFTSGGVPAIVKDVNDVRRLARQHGSLTDGVRAKVATNGLNLVAKGDGKLAGEAFSNLVDATSRTVQASGSTLTLEQKRELELLKLLANPRGDAAQNAVVNLARDELHHRETGK
ncbi:hypothetical protein [Actinophytocola xanthii]|uniref:WXG100 family type VII secretion target n=1 Tax=Actinophytocola xanthii TaxID=1912961 RepID=A0A1Q8CW81_9PSEU|nr:hypothetical protein [Actinophytocola xanthii]OLF18621.1 hypothetical protein BU204_04980 [Actinophytocola xanthii]